MSQQSHSWAFIPEKWQFMSTEEPLSEFKWMFIAALFETAPKERKPQCPTIGE